jgi:hypothetical protein
MKTKDVKRALKKLLDYMEHDEQRNFWENCECDEEIVANEIFDKCKCKGNKKHIYKSMVILRKWVKNK